MQPELIQFSDLQVGDRFAGIVCAWSCEPRRTRQDKPFLSLQLRDLSTSLLPGVMWDADAHDAPQCPATIYIEGDVQTFQGSLQLRLQIMKVTDHDLELFVPTSYRPIPELTDELDGLIELIHDYQLREVVVTSLNRVPGFWTAPAAIGFHGAYRGGLLEHTVNVTRVCLNAADIYGERVSQDLLVAGAILHDIGKADAYDSPESRNPNETERMLGHIVHGAMLVEQTATDLEYAGEIPVEEILHLILSHHGELQFGAPIKPSTAEALILSAADTLEADTTGYFDYWRDESDGKEWSFSRQRDGWIKRPAERARTTADAIDDLPF